MSASCLRVQRLCPDCVLYPGVPGVHTEVSRCPRRLQAVIDAAGEMTEVLIPGRKPIWRRGWGRGGVSAGEDIVFVYPPNLHCPNIE